MNDPNISADSNARYERHELLQAGAVETWSGLDRTLNRPVTIRRAAADSEVAHRLRLQAKALARVEHHGLLHIFDTYDEPDHFAIVTEQLPPRRLVDDITASDHSIRRLDAGEAVRIVIAVAEAVAVLHSAGFAHGGVEAECIGWRAEVGWVILDGPPTDDTVAIPATRRADLASLAMLAHRLMVGVPPQRRSDGIWEIDPAVPDVVATVLARAIGASDRWPDVPSMLLALRSVVNDLPAVRGPLMDRRSVWQAERLWLVPVGILVAAAATLVGIALFIEQPSQPEAQATATSAAVSGASEAQPEVTPRSRPAATGSVPVTPTVPPAPLTTDVRRMPVLLESITDFDPAGDDRIEHPERLRFINDGDADTGWSSARYNTRDFGGLKDGVGLIVVLAGDEPRPVERLTIDSPSVGWSFELYMSRERNRTLIDWGSPVAEARDITGSTVLDVPRVEAAALLVWITDLGAELTSGGHRVTISGIEVAAMSGPSSAPSGTDAVTP
ncbi:hypothetical protein [Candidatus Poriferisodalis sp.]|uniref:hypothetical protein n=1 Tax=Candidatus Poriferisodalis sp. TaxID=3101277 RepID=UPI003B02ABCF